MIGKGGAFFVGRGKGYGNKQALTLQVAVFLTLAFHFLVVNAFGGSVHIDEQQAVFGLGKDVDAKQLGNGKAERRQFGLGWKAV